MSKRWLGVLRGSRTGTLFLEEMDEGSSSFVVGLTGGADIRLILTRPPNSSAGHLIDDAGASVGTIQFEHDQETKKSGKWRFATGAEGIFDLELANPASEQDTSAQELPRIWNRELPIGAVTLYRSDIDRLIAEMQSLVERPATTFIRAQEGENTIVEPAAQYLARANFVDVVRVMTITAEEKTNKPLKRLIALNLNDDGSSQIVVSSTEEIWTTAAVLRMSGFLNQFTSRISGWLRKYGLNINAFILLAVFIWMPDFPLAQRILVVVAAVVLIALIARSHRLLPYNRVYLNPDRVKHPLTREVPAVIMAGVASAVLAVLSSVPEIIEAVKRAVDAIF